MPEKLGKVSAAGDRMAKKTLHIHLGPHKTGSSAIQRALKTNSDLLQSRFGLTPIATAPLAKVAKLLNADRAFDAADLLERIAGTCRDAPGDCLMSCEDLCGALPGTRGVREVYPHLWRNIAVLEEAFAEFDRRYYFFIRSPEDWIRSAYVQNLKHRQKFNSFDGFRQFLRTGGLWDDVVAGAVSALGSSFVRIPYDAQKKTTATRALLTAIPGCEQADVSLVREDAANVSPTVAEVALMERINRSSASQEAKRLAKLALLSKDSDGPMPTHAAEAEPFAHPDKPEDLPKALHPLWKRVDMRVHTQDQPNLMPELDVDLRLLRADVVDGPAELPDVARADMKDQVEILSYRFRDQSRLCYLLGLTISYLRRDTPYTSHASHLFQRLWREEYRILLGLLPTRWLTSSFQTFLDHGVNADQKIIGSGAYFYANILKAYETERAFEGNAPDAIYPDVASQTKMGFAGLDRFKLGGSDLLVNTNALLLELSAREEVAGRVVQEFMVRAKNAQTIFSRMDQSRKAHDINIKRFSNCWSFFDEP